MPLSYRFITALLAFTGCISLVITGELILLFMIPGIALIPGYYRFLRGGAPAPRWVISWLAAVAAGVVVFDTLMVSSDFFVAVAHMTIVFQALKSFDLKEPWDHLQVYFMSLLQLIMASELAVSMAVGGMFVVFLFIFVAAIVLSHFVKEGTLSRVSIKKPMAIISLVAFLATSVFFVAVPRAKGSIWQRKSWKGIRSVGFSDKVDFGSFGEVLEDSSIVMRVSVSGPKLPLYWRGITLDNFDGTAWKDTLKRRARIDKLRGRFSISRGGPKRAETVQKIYMEPVDNDVIFGLGEITSLESRGWFLFRDIAGSLYLPFKSDRKFSYTAHSVPGGDLRVRLRYMYYYLQLPPGVERIRALAQEVAGAAETELETARLIENYLRTNYAYALKTSPPPEGISPIEHFLFNSRSGYCEHFATSMVLMLRSMGIQSRIVTGFAGGKVNWLGDYIIVRQKDAHSWVEAAIDDKWMRFDPTPPAPEGEPFVLGFLIDFLKMNWYRYVVGFDTDDQRYLVRHMTLPVITMPEFAGIRLNIRPVYLIVMAVILMPLAGGFMFRRWPRRSSFETRAYLKFRNAVKKRGGNVRASSTPAEVVREARRLNMDTDGAAEFIGLYESVRFGGMELDRKGRKRYVALAKTASSRK
jgi:transglutaminase-like putative cysteine protease